MIYGRYVVAEMETRNFEMVNAKKYQVIEIHLPYFN